MKKNFHLISGNPKLSKISKPNLLLPTERTNPFLITFRKTILQINNFIPTQHLVDNANFARK